jgi:hypothetical protein
LPIWSSIRSSTSSATSVGRRARSTSATSAGRATSPHQQQSARSSPSRRSSAIYGDAGKDLKQSGSYVDKALKAVGRGEPTALSGLVRQAMLRERGSARNANTAARASNLTDLQNKITGAAAGKALALTTARRPSCRPGARASLRSSWI